LRSRRWQYSLLSALAVRGTADQTTLAADVALDRTTTTGALKRLQLRNFVERSIHHSDRRAQLCRLTKAGANLLRRMERSARAAHRETVADLSKADQKRFVAMMRRLWAARSQQEEAGGALLNRWPQSARRTATICAACASNAAASRS